MNMRRVEAWRKWEEIYQEKKEKKDINDEVKRSASEKN